MRVDGEGMIQTTNPTGAAKAEVGVKGEVDSSILSCSTILQSRL
jgi:hypothetical protein